MGLNRLKGRQRLGQRCTGGEEGKPDQQRGGGRKGCCKSSPKEANHWPGEPLITREHNCLGLSKSWPIERKHKPKENLDFSGYFPGQNPAQPTGEEASAPVEREIL